MPNDKQIKNILAVRFSALGDVAICAVVLREFLEQNPNTNLTFVSQEFHRPLFEGIDRLEFVGVNLKIDYNSPLSMFTLASKLLKGRDYDFFVDLHNVLRTHLLRLAMRIRGISVFKMYKGRHERRALVSRENKVIKPLRAIAELYADVFRRAGFDFKLSGKFKKSHINISPSAEKLLPESKTRSWLAVAPFAQHTGKVYPEKLMLELLKKVTQNGQIEVFLFGSPLESEKLSLWASELPNTTLIAGRSNLKLDIELISRMDLMLSMDSANMHIASLVGVRTVSIWGSTHPYAGFMGYGQSCDDAVELNMDCRPCSVFGNKECYKGTYECMWGINPELVATKIFEVLQMETDEK